jgi:hypothetical protein
MGIKKAFWLTYDLGIKGDYTGLYTFLDSLEAKECGDSIAFFQKDYGDDFIDALTKDIQKNIKITRTDRFYVVYIESSTGKAKGKFLYGGRKRAPWEGYAAKGISTEEDS